MNVKIQQQVHKSGETENYLTVLLQDDVWVVVGGIQAERMIHDGKEEAQSKFTAEFKLKPSTLY